MKVKFNQNLYDTIITDGNLILDSLKETLIFVGLGGKIEEDCDDEFWKEGFKYMSRASFESEWMDSNVQTYVETYRSDAKKVHDLSKILN